MYLAARSSSWAAGGGSLPTPQEVSFDGSNDYLLKTGGLNGAGGTQAVSILLRFRTGSTGVKVFYASSNFEIFLDAAEQLRVVLNTSGAVAVCSLRTSITVNDANEHSMHFNYNGATGAGRLFLDGVDREEVVTETTGTMDMTGDAAIGAFTGGGSKWNGSAWRLCIWSDVVLDVSNASVRTSMSDPTLASSLGTNIVDVFGSVTDWNNGTNWGTGGNFVMNGAVT